MVVVEVGAGDGEITEGLSGLAGKVFAYELDTRHFRRLQARMAPRENVYLMNENFLDSTPPNYEFVVVGNMPFGATSSIIDWCLGSVHMKRAVFITQREYPRKRSGYYGRWSKVTVESWPWYEWTLIGEVPKRSFRPVPSVDAAIL